jgi:hypothetical protein
LTWITAGYLQDISIYPRITPGHRRVFIKEYSWSKSGVFSKISLFYPGIWRVPLVGGACRLLFASRNSWALHGLAWKMNGAWCAG